MSAYATIPQMQALAVMSGSVLSGVLMSMSYVTVPVILNTARDGNQAYRQWLRTYNAGFPEFPTISALTGVLYLYTAYRKHLVGSGWVETATAGVLSMLLVPVTWAFLVPWNDHLKAIEKTTYKPETSLDLEQAKKDVKYWNHRHMFRTMFPLVGALIGMKGMLDLTL